MKKMMKMIKRMKKSNNEGFSLVELIIVISIMAILMGVVGTQVLPYLNRSKESNDQQLLAKIHTAAVSAFAFNADTAPVAVSAGAYVSYKYTGSSDGGTIATPINNEIHTLMGLSTTQNILNYFVGKATSPNGKDVKCIELRYDDEGKITLIAYKDAAGTAGTEVLKKVESK